MRGVFLVLEGVDGCGKSTQAARLVARIATTGRDVLHVREPGGTRLGERVRSLLLDHGTGDVTPVAEVFLYQAARAQLVAEVVRPALEERRVVVCERWHYATTAYQGVAGGAGVDVVATTSRIATGGLEPDRGVLLDLPVGLADGRLGDDLDRIESRGERYRARVADALRALFEAQPGRLRIVPATGTPEAVEAQVWKAVRDVL